MGSDHTAVTFKRKGLELKGNLYTPYTSEGRLDEKKQYPAVVIQGSFTSVKEMMSTNYTLKLADKGYLALVFDYAHYGESEGYPRQLESPEEKLADLQAAVSYLSCLPYVSSVGVIGICTSASNVAYLAATADERIRAFATVAAYLPSPSFLASIMGEDYYKQGVARGEAAERKFSETSEVEFATVYSDSDHNPMKGIYDYYTNTLRGNVSQYRNEVAVMSIRGFYSLDPLAIAPSITAPTLVVHSDGCAFPEQAKAFYAALPGEKEMAWLDGTHFDYYDNPKQIDNAVDRVSQFSGKHLK